MAMMDQATKFLWIVVIVFVILGIGVGIVWAIWQNNRKKKSTSEDNVDYTGFQRKDSCDYIKLDDIKDNMIILENGTRFVGIIGCQGFDFYSAQRAEQALTAQSFVSLINTIKKPISYRQYSKAIDLEHTINRYKEAHEKVITRLYNAQEDIKDIEKFLTNEGMNENDRLLYENKLISLQSEIRALENRELHLRDQISYCQSYSGNNVLPELKETWVFDWTYHPFDFPVQLTKEEIYERAKQELLSLENTYRHALSACRVKARRCNTEELIEMCRRYSAPLTSDRFRLRDVIKSAFFQDIITSDSVQELVDEVQTRAEEEFEMDFESSMKETVMQMQSTKAEQSSVVRQSNNNKQDTKGNGPKPANRKTYATTNTQRGELGV